MSYKLKIINCWKNIMRFMKKVSNSIKKGFDSGPVYNEKYLKTKKNFIMEKSTQIFTVPKYQKKVLNVFVYW